ncbi:MAG: amidohydrolase family protein, partial [Acidobacteria bacterium]|nr:amidohydrolase family protein [Acidobacteriota bacterium]
MDQPSTDLIIRNATVVDGTGAPGRIADVVVSDGRITAVTDPGVTPTGGAEELDATGSVVTPGFIDPHTHYDAQLFWDPTASPSALHGVTTVIGGNCGFTLAPLTPGDGDYVRRMMAKVEGMPLAALEQGIDWDWSSFEEYLDRLEGNLGVNAGFLVGHCALRRVVMGPEATTADASPEQLDAMRELLAESLRAGGLGFSTTRART